MIPPIQPVISTNNRPKYRAFIAIYDQKYAVTDTITRERTECANEAEMWEKFAELQSKGILV